MPLKESIAAPLFPLGSSPLPIMIDADPAMMIRGGLDIDDDLAILFALGSPELEVRGITITYGNTSVGKALQDARRLLSRAGRKDIPLRKGAGWLSRNIDRPTQASRFIVDEVRKSDRDLEQGIIYRAFLNIFKLFSHGHTQICIQVRKRFVQKKHLGFKGQGPGQGYPLLLPSAYPFYGSASQAFHVYK